MDGGVESIGSQRGCSPSEGFADHTANLTIISVRPSPSYGILWMMSTEGSKPLAAALTPTSYLVLGLLAREGPSTPYELKRHVARTIGHFWSFPHALLYKEPARLVELGLLTEERELEGRRRRLFTITQPGRQALRTWLSRPARQPTELRDVALLQLFFADLEPTTATLAIAEEQLALHREQLAGYLADPMLEERG